MPLVIQDFSVPVGNALDVTFQLDPADGIGLSGAEVLWRAYVAVFAVPSAVPSIVKTSGASDSFGEEITVVESPPPGSFTVHLRDADTVDLPVGNYYHEAAVLEAGGALSTVFRGTLTVTLAEIGA